MNQSANLRAYQSADLRAGLALRAWNYRKALFTERDARQLIAALAKRYDIPLPWGFLQQECK